MILPACGASRTVGQVGLVRHRRVVLARDERLRGRPGLMLTTVTSFTDMPFFLRNHASVKYGAVPGARGADGLALEVGDLRDVVARGHAVGAVALVELEDLRGRHAVGVPHDPGLDGRRRALDIAGSDGEVPVLLRNFLDVDVEAVLLEDAGLLGEGERREAGPAGNADGDLGSCAPAAAA